MIQGSNLPRTARDARAFVTWIRTGRRTIVRAAADRVFTKINPYHDPHDGRFTFAPGGTGRGGVSRAALEGRSARSLLRPAQYTPPPRGSNSRAFQDPITLDQVVLEPGGTPGRAVFGFMDHLLSLTGPADALTTQLTIEHAQYLIAHIKAMDPHYHYDSLGLPQTAEGQARVIQELLWRRAAVAHTYGDSRCLQIQVYHEVQMSANRRYTEALHL